MSKRAFKAFAVNSPGFPQPLVGTLTGAAIPAGVSNFLLAVNDSSMFIKGDWAILTNPNGVGGNVERVQIASVPDGTHVVLKSVLQAHVIPVLLGLAGACSGVIVQGVPGNVAGMYIGSAPTMAKVGLVQVVYRLIQSGAAVQPPVYTDGSSSSYNSDDMANWWIDADNNTDLYLPSFSII